MQTASSAYVPPFQLTKGQPAPIAANGGLSYMSFDQDGDAGTAAAMEEALRLIAEGEGQAVIDMIDNAPPGPIETKWGVGFRTYDECLDYIGQTTSKPRRAVSRCRCATRSTISRPTPLFRQRAVAGPGTRSRGKNVSQGRPGDRATRSLFSTDITRRAADGGVLPGSVAH